MTDHTITLDLEPGLPGDPFRFTEVTVDEQDGRQLRAMIVLDQSQWDELGNPRRIHAALTAAPADDPNRGPTQVARELNAIANNLRPDPRRRRPHIIATMEAIGRTMPQLEHYHPPIHDRSDKSRANLCLYVLDRLTLGPRRWHPCHETWPRPDHPNLGPHEPRTFLEQEVEDWTVILGHAPQVAPHTEQARAEWLDVLERIVLDTPHNRPVDVVTDPNGLADKIEARLPMLETVATPIEAAQSGPKVRVEAAKLAAVNGVVMLSDHKGTLLGTATRARRD